MKVLLLMPPYPKSKIFRKSMKHLGAVLPPLGIAYIAAVLEKEGHDVRIIDGPAQSNVEGYSFENLKKDISSFNPDVAGVSASTSQIDLAKQALRIIKQINSKCLTVVGGPLVSAAPDALMELEDADYGVYGEADLTFVKILDAYKKGKKKLNGMEGIIWRDKGKVHFKKPELIIELDKIPMPARHLLKMHIYRPSPANYRRLPATTIMSCYDDKTEILTDNGWKFFNELLPEDKVASLNPIDDTILYEKPRHLTKTFFEGDLISFRSKQIDLMVTPNHNMYVNLTDRNKGFVQLSDGNCIQLSKNKFMLIPAEKIISRHRIEFKKDGIWIGRENDVFILPGVDDKPAKEIPMDLWLEFFGYWIAEGNANKKSNNRYIVKISQVDLYKRTKMASCIEKLGYNYYSHHEYFEISNKQLCTYLKQFGKAPDKYIPKELLELCPRQLKILFDALVLGDGCPSKISKEIWYSTTSKRLADNVQEILFKLGISGTVGLKKQKKPGYIKGRPIKSIKQGYVVSSNNTQNTPLLRESVGGKIEKVPYKGYVYCCEVPSHIIYVRRNGKTVWCGNSRGCPYKCIFCSRSIEGLAFRYHSAKRVVDELELLQNKYGIKDVQFFDDTFTMVPKRTEDICRGLIERGVDIGWNCMTRVDRISPELFRLMKRAGCYEVGFGIESGSERVLKFIKKEIEKDQVRKAVKWAHNAGIDARGFFMIGFPTETKEEILQTINFAKELNVDVAQFMVATPYPGTKLWEIAQEYGKINNEDWSSFTFYAPDKMPFSSNILSDQEVRKLYKKAYKSYYLRPLFMLRQALKIRSLDDIQRNWLAFKGISDF